MEPDPDGRLELVKTDVDYRRSHHDVNRIHDGEAVAFYYEAARQFLHRHRFASDIQRRIWELHTDGVSVKRIESHLRREGVRGRVRHDVQTAIAALRARMLNPAKRGRPARPGGCHKDSRTFQFRMQDGVWEALCHLEQRWKLSKQEVIRRLVFEAGKAT